MMPENQRHPTGQEQSPALIQNSGQGKFGEIIIYDELRKQLAHVSLALFKELIRRFAWRKIDWRKLFLAGAVMSIAGIILPTFLLAYHRNSRFESPNGTMHLSKNLTEARLDKSQLVTSAPFVSLNSSIEAKESARVLRMRQNRRKTIDVLKVVHPPPRRMVPRHLQRYLQSLSSHEALLYAKREIEHAPLVENVGNNSYLYAPVFRNISIFKRSYELMEMILKVYIYRDGKKPIFHQPRLNGIYASEGWFMKLMEANREFVTKEPEKAHLFYLPYSSRQLELALYVRNSHNLRPLSKCLRDYVNMIASKYPFWNRTHGSDHFLVACHDWGPFITTEHVELKDNAIKALCNADLKENFVVGKDVSLPETAIRIASKPLRNIGGGIRVSQRPILAFFAGKMHGSVRPKLLKHWLNKDADMRIYGPLSRRVSKNMSYVRHMKSSKYCICPMGYEVNSPRIVEAIYYECVPVIIADNFVLPLSEVLEWKAFSVTVAEIDIPKLKEILLAIPLKRYLQMLMNVKMVQKHFLWNPNPMRYDLFHMILHSIWYNRLNQIQIPQS
ncbi:putative glycosyltransferase [Gossypium australe]|uniref:Putative glycosyltransferase n=1 Tax=Gossypium australe TaxID=47621 RepID=A0A5B6VJ52_9ROSI|nr:putative glycosyltransferase [Gossypium australe]